MLHELTYLCTHSRICCWIICSMHYPQLPYICYTEESQAFNSRDEWHEAVLAWAVLGWAGVPNKYKVDICISDVVQLPSKAQHLSWANDQHEILNTTRWYVIKCETVNLGLVVVMDRNVQFLFANLLIIFSHPLFSVPWEDKYQEGCKCKCKDSCEIT